MQSYASATGSRSETTFKLKWGQLNIYAHSTGEYTMAPDEPWAERKYSQGLPPGKVKGFRAQDVVAAPTECTMEGYLEGRDYVPVEHGKQEVMDIVPFLTTEAEMGEWSLEGLPSDGLSIQNGILVTRSSRWPLQRLMLAAGRVAVGVGGHVALHYLLLVLLGA